MFTANDSNLLLKDFVRALAVDSLNFSSIEGTKHIVSFLFKCTSQ
jgi:hypothetical protein